MNPQHYYNKAKEELGEQPKLSLEQLVDGARKVLGNLGFTDKKAIVRKLVTKVKATQEETIIWGQVPILVTEKVGLRAEHRNRGVAKRWQVYPV